MKISNPREVAFFSAFICSVLLTSILTILQLSVQGSVDFLKLGIVLLSGLVIIYATVYYFIERFLQGRIRVIYKTIHNLNANQVNRLRIDMSQDVLGSVNQEVQSWSRVKSEEIRKLKANEAYRREFLGNLSHELKTPIFSVQGYVLTLLEGGIDDPNINRDFLLKASKGIDRISHIVEDLDTITNLESGRLKLLHKNFNIVELAKEIIDSLEYKVREKNRILRMDDEYSSIYVEADKNRIGQVLTNLISNSVAYGDEGGTTEVKFEKVDEMLLIEVSDDGPGIAQEHLSRLFERFYRVDRSRARNAGGTGLGLAIVKHIIEAHGQTISVQSQEGVGSVFSFTLKKGKRSAS